MLSEPEGVQHQLVRSLRLLDIIMLGIAGMIGGAVFVLTGPAIGLAGGSVIIAFLINGLITLFTAMAYAELGSARPEAGGGYLWVREGLPRPNAFISGWIAWFAHMVAGSLYAVGFGAFVKGLLSIIISDLTQVPFDKLIAVISIIVLTYINAKGTSETGKAGTIITLIQLGTIGVLIGAGFWSINTHPDWIKNFDDFMPFGVGGIAAAMGITFIAFEGYEIIVQAGEEVKDPKRNIPRAIFISLAVVTALYCLVAFISIAAIFPGIPSWKFIGDYNELGIMKAAELIMPYGAFIVLAGGMVSTLAALNATTFSSSRVAFAMGRHYNLPHLLSAIHSKNKTPHIAIIISGVIMAIMAYILPLEEIAVAASLIFLLLFAQVNAAVMNIRRIYGDRISYGFKMPFFPLISIVGVLLNIGLALYLLITQPLSLGITALWIVIGLVLYRMYTFKKEIEHYAPVITSAGDIQRKDYRILIPFTPEDPDRLIRYAIRIAKEMNGEINILRVITVPNQTPLSVGIAYAEAARRSFELLKPILDKEKILSHYLVRVSHDFTEAMLATVEEQKINLLLTDFEEFRNNSKLRTLITCDVLAINTKGAITFEDKEPKTKMVVLYDAREHSDLVLKTMSWFEHSGKYRVNVLSLVEEAKEETVATIKQKEYLDQVAFEFNEIQISERTRSNSERLAKLLLSNINIHQPELVIVGADIGKFSILTNSHLIRLVNQLNCSVIIARAFTIPGISSIKSAMVRVIRRMR